jgi:hypothetical protein
MLKKIKDFLNCADIKDDENKIKKRRTLFTLLIDFSFLPQVVAAAWIYSVVANDSVVLIKQHMQIAFLFVFIEIVVFAVMTAVKKFYLSRFLLIAAYLQLIITMYAVGFSGRELMLFGTLRWYNVIRADSVFYVFAGVGIILAIVNLLAFYGYKNIKEMEKLYE